VKANVSIVGDDLEKMKKFVDLLKTQYLQYNLTSEQKSEMEADIKSIESQLTS
jgi:16S rRNA G527 N7-methylase RsmG